MRKILEDLYYGNIAPNAKSFSKNSPYAKAMGKLGKSDAYLQEVLDEEGKAMLKHFEDAQSEVSDIGIREAFIDGFRLGAKLMLAALSEDDGELRPLI